ncbi:unnamed protein product [Penicillium pancosmium]
MAEATAKGGIIDNVSQLSDPQKDPNALRERNLVDLEDPDAKLSQEEREAIDRRLLWKLDLRLVPWLSLLYLISFLDR